MLQATNLWQLIERRAEATPDAQMAVDEIGRSMTFAEYRDRCEAVAAGLAERGVGEDTRVSWQLPTWLEAMVLMGALRRLGAVQNPILPIYREREVGFIVEQARPRLLVVPSTWKGFDFAAMASELTADLDGVDVLTCDRALPTGDPSTLPPAPTDDMDADDAPIRWIYYTSGTTSEPKGALHTDASLKAAGQCMSEGLGLADDDRFALVFPYTHIAGGVYLYSSLAYGCAFILDEAFDPGATIDLLRKQGVTQAGAGTYFHQVYLQAQQQLPDGEQLFADVRTFPGGGAPKPPQLHHALKEAFDCVGIISGYGLTEAPILTMAHADDTDEVLANTEGRAGPGVTLRIVDLDGQEAPAGEEGEVRAKGQQVTRGYLDPSLMDDAFDADGWFRTGDLGRLDADGNLTITGRIKDVIIRKGENISAKELEDLLFAHPSVADAAVVGLPDADRGELACAVVVPADGTSFSFDDMTQYLTEQGMITRKLPERLELVDALPRNPTGKVLKYELRDRFSG